MSMSDCPKCWETPCMCGHEYKDWPRERIEELAGLLLRILDERSLEQSKPVDPPRLFSLCNINREGYQHIVGKDVNFVYMGEIPNMPGHCVVAGCTTGKIYSGLHIDNFVEMGPEEM